MNRPTIRVCQYVAKLPRSGNDPTANTGPRERRRWRAELLNESNTLRHVEGFLDRDQAIGALVRDIAADCTGPVEAIDLVASIFGDLGHRSVEVTLGRAIRMALRNTRRLHPGVLLEIEELPANCAPQLQLARAGKGGSK